MNQEVDGISPGLSERSTGRLIPEYRKADVIGNLRAGANVRVLKNWARHDVRVAARAD